MVSQAERRAEELQVEWGGIGEIIGVGQESGVSGTSVIIFITSFDKGITWFCYNDTSKKLVIMRRDEIEEVEGGDKLEV